MTTQHNMPPIPEATITSRDATALELLFSEPSGHTDEAMQEYARAHAAALAEKVRELEANNRGLKIKCGEFAEEAFLLNAKLVALAAARQPVEARDGRDAVIEAARKLVKAKGRYHTEQNYKALADALAAISQQERKEGGEGA